MTGSNFPHTSQRRTERKADDVQASNDGRGIRDRTGAGRAAPAIAQEYPKGVFEMEHPTTGEKALCKDVTLQPREILCYARGHWITVIPDGFGGWATSPNYPNVPVPEGADDSADAVGEMFNDPYAAVPAASAVTGRARDLIPSAPREVYADEHCVAELVVNIGWNSDTDAVKTGTLYVDWGDGSVETSEWVETFLSVPVAHEYGHTGGAGALHAVPVPGTGRTRYSHGVKLRVVASDGSVADTFLIVHHTM